MATVTDHRYLQGTSADELAALILEVASQLHVERQRRVALEIALHRQGVLETAAVERLATDSEVEQRGRADLEEVMTRLLRIVLTNGDPRSPLGAPK